MYSGFVTRLASSAACVALICALASAEEATGKVRLVVQGSPLAGFRYHAAAEVWQELRVGESLTLERERDNAYDADAVSVSWRGRKLGYVPRRENAALAWGLDHGERFGARISRLRLHPNPARRLEFEVYAE